VFPVVQIQSNAATVDNVEYFVVEYGTLLAPPGPPSSTIRTYLIIKCQQRNNRNRSPNLQRDEHVSFFSVLNSRPIGIFCRWASFIQKRNYISGHFRNDLSLAVDSVRIVVTSQGD
jgi:hypothetical protein